MVRGLTQLVSHWPHRCQTIRWFHTFRFLLVFTSHLVFSLNLSCRSCLRGTWHQLPLNSPPWRTNSSKWSWITSQSPQVMRKSMCAVYQRSEDPVTCGLIIRFSVISFLLESHRWAPCWSTELTSFASWKRRWGKCSRTMNSPVRRCSISYWIH